tara:strand:- start:1855 stop:2784 length:930 start_codon:yes stop_codon:yes gene_type:complete
MNFFKPRFWDKKQISVFSIFLLPASIIIQIFSKIKNLLTKCKKFSIPIICVGNIYLGGTGKTPICIELNNILKNLNKKTAYVRKKHDVYQDEKNLLEQSGPVYEQHKRTDAINDVVENKFEVAILDDGFQDFSIKKDFSIICFNEKQWVGNGFTIPSGPLREKISSLKRADCVLINGKYNNDIENQILKSNNLIKIFYFKYESINIENFKDKRVICFAGIGNPKNFFSLLKENEVNVLEEISFPDHYNYSKADLDNLIKQAKQKNSILLTTEKDYLRIHKDNRKNIYCLKIKVKIEKKNEFVEEIKKII